mmetsp:Transcript_30569/g.65697  ORF Transcript_30569/g.65697 Transcript_30569/m.65697 type:complete len:87 (+) Transcript_30569:1085-1345(+)
MRPRVMIYVHPQTMHVLRPHLHPASSISASRDALMQVKAAPRAVDERDDKLLSNLMSTLEAQNQEIGGDDDEEEQDEGMGNVDVGA